MAHTTLAVPTRPTATTVVVRACGRLHMGFLDPSGSLGRRFGGVGLVLDEPRCEVEIAAAAVDELVADSDDALAELGRAAAHVAALRAASGVNRPLALRLRRVLPAHAGFGSGTQLALAVGRGFARLHGLEVPTPQLARWLGRGLRSGIGIAGFDQGGLLVDGGPGADGTPAPVLARIEPPAAWRVVVAIDPCRRGLSGEDERRAIATLPPLARAQAADLCHQVLMRMLPGAAAGDFRDFAAGVNAVQALLGTHFAPAQSGSAWTSPAVGRLMSRLRDEAGAAVGQSSWGPTGFAILPDTAAVERALGAARRAGVVDDQLSLHVTAIRRSGAAIEWRPGSADERSP